MSLFNKQSRLSHYELRRKGSLMAKLYPAMASNLTQQVSGQFRSVKFKGEESKTEGCFEIHESCLYGSERLGFQIHLAEKDLLIPIMK